MKHFKLIILSLCLLATCRNKQEKIIFDEDVQQVITSCITETMGYGDTIRYYYKLIPELIKADRLKFVEKYNDSLRLLLDTALVYLIVKDTLGKIGVGDREDLDHFIKTYLSDVDSTKLYLRKEYLNPLPQTLDLHKLEEKLTIQIKSKEQGINDKIRIIGKCIFSNVVFNKSKNNAVVLLNFMSTTHIGYGELFFLNKENNNWKVVKRERTWIS